MRNASECEQPEQPAEWRLLNGRPFYNEKELQLVSTHGDVAEFQSPTGKRFLRVSGENGTEWFSKPFERTKATRAKVKVCCKKFRYAFGIFIDRRSQVPPVCIFAKSDARTSRHFAEIIFCPFCGKKVEFLEPKKQGGLVPKSALGEPAIAVIALRALR